ncbi:transposase [Kitasatospora sp. NPDC088783]|uniref:transposase n=1 Tax=Kitasatospora sp. NPDC088783 TaxID=3364077 RepID=UPI003809F6D4
MQMARRERELERGPLAHGWTDQRWSCGSGRSGRGHDLLQPGERSRLIYAIHEYRARKEEAKGFDWKGYRDLVIRAHIQLDSPIVLVWDNLRAHLIAPLQEFIEANTDWLTVFQLPIYAPDLNPQEGIWSLVKRDIGNLAAADLGRATRAVKRKLKMLQYRPEVIDGCLRGTCLTLPVDRQKKPKKRAHQVGR